MADDKSSREHSVCSNCFFLNVVGKIFGADRFPTPVPEFLRKKYPIISAGEIGERHQKVNQNNIGEHVIHDPGFRRSVKTATNPVFQHGITQYEAFDLFNGFKTCTVELLDELIRYFKNALSEQDTFTKSEWRVRYPEKHGATGNKLMVTKDEQKNEQKERENQDRGGDDDFFDIQRGRPRRRRRRRRRRRTRRRTRTTNPTRTNLVRIK